MHLTSLHLWPASLDGLGLLWSSLLEAFSADGGAPGEGMKELTCSNAQQTHEEFESLMALMPNLRRLELLHAPNVTSLHFLGYFLLSRSLRCLCMPGEYNRKLSASRFAELYDSLPCLERLELQGLVEFNAEQLALLQRWPCPLFPRLRFFIWTDAYGRAARDANESLAVEDASERTKQRQSMQRD